MGHYTGLGAIGIITPTPADEGSKITIKPRIVYEFSEIPDDQGGHGSPSPFKKYQIKSEL